jgi:proline iminopeptidase
MRRGFDPERYLVVVFDQRGCGRSTPNASDPATDMSVNTTPHLVADMERLREHLQIERWLVSGGSWGCTLALAYAELHQDRVSEIVLSAVTTSRRSEAEWLYRGAAMFFPEEYERFLGAVPEAAVDGDVFGAYVRRMADPDPGVRAAAAAAWSDWEDAVLSLERAGQGPFGNREEAALQAMVRICAHYALHGAWLAEGALIRDAGLLSGIPGVLIHGRHDLSCPATTAWELAQAWPGVRLLIDDGSGHHGSEQKRRWMRGALDEFAMGWPRRTAAGLDG